MTLGFNLTRWFLLVLIFVESTAWAETFTARMTTVPDGDTLWVQPEGNSPARKLRLLGIDAPEICQAGGQASRAALIQLVGHAPLQVDVRHYDDYGRGLARIRVNGKDVGAAMVLAGEAWSYRWRRSPGLYASEEAAARNARKGLFSAASPELPRNFRQRHGSCYPP